MPEFHCIDCHHEWEGGRDRVKCDWCGGPAVIIAQMTALESMMRQINPHSIEGQILREARKANE